MAISLSSSGHLDQSSMSLTVASGSNFLTSSSLDSFRSTWKIFALFQYRVTSVLETSAILLFFFESKSNGTSDLCAVVFILSRFWPARCLAFHKINSPGVANGKLCICFNVPFELDQNLDWKLKALFPVSIVALMVSNHGIPRITWSPMGHTSRGTVAE